MRRPTGANAAAADQAAVPNTIEHAGSSYEEILGDEPLPLPLHRTDILSCYRIHGVEYHSNCFGPNELVPPTAIGRRRCVAQVLAQSESRCYVNPINRQQAC